MARAQATTHQFGRDVLARVWARATGENPSLAELQIAGAVATLETTYGRGWHGAGAGSNNWGAITCGTRAVNGQCPAGCFPSEDSSPGQGAEVRCFRVYASPDDGAHDLIRAITVRRPRSWAAMKAGDIDGFSRAMRGLTGDPVYFEGVAKGAEERANPALQKENSAMRHAGIVDDCVREIAAAMGEEIAATRGGGSAGDPFGASQPSGSGSDSPTCSDDDGYPYDDD